MQSGIYKLHADCLVILRVIMLSVIYNPFMLNVHYAECRYVECRSAKFKVTLTLEVRYITINPKGLTREY